MLPEGAGGADPGLRFLERRYIRSSSVQNCSGSISCLMPRDSDITALARGRVPLDNIPEGSDTMKSTFAAITTASLIAFAHAPAHAGMGGLAAVPITKAQTSGLVHKTGRGGRRLATGFAIGLGILGIMAASRAHAGRYDADVYDYEYERRFNHRCRRWRRRCINGNDRACLKHEDLC